MKKETIICIIIVITISVGNIITQKYILVDLWYYKENPNCTEYLNYFLQLAMKLNDEQYSQIKSYCQFILKQADNSK